MTSCGARTLRLPERGRIGIFNRSYYEEVLVVRVHPEYLAAQRLPECGCIERRLLGAAACARSATTRRTCIAMARGS